MTKAIVAGRAVSGSAKGIVEAPVALAGKAEAQRINDVHNCTYIGRVGPNRSGS
jgi:hypothetical protein